MTLHGESRLHMKRGEQAGDLPGTAKKRKQAEQNITKGRAEGSQGKGVFGAPSSEPH